MTVWYLKNSGLPQAAKRAIGRPALAALGILGLVVLLALAACSPAVTLKGTDLGKDPAPAFQLTDQNGKTVSLSDLSGRVVVLTFLYTHCPDVCPLIADHLRVTIQQLGSTTENVAFVAISVDPEHDTPAAIQTFEGEHGLNRALLYLNGPQEQLQRVWADYYVASETNGDSPTGIAHSTRVIVIDKAGKQRVNLDSDFDPADLAYDVRALMNE